MMSSKMTGRGLVGGGTPAYARPPCSTDRPLAPSFCSAKTDTGVCEHTSRSSSSHPRLQGSAGQPVPTGQTQQVPAPRRSHGPSQTPHSLLWAGPQT